MKPVISYKLGLNWIWYIFGTSWLCLIGLVIILGGYAIFGLPFLIIPGLYIYKTSVKIDFYVEHVVFNFAFHKKMLDYSRIENVELKYAGRTGWGIKIKLSNTRYAFSFDSKYFTADLFTFLRSKRIKIILDPDATWIYYLNGKYFIKDIYPRNNKEVIRRQEIDSLLSSEPEYL